MLSPSARIRYRKPVKANTALAGAAPRSDLTDGDIGDKTRDRWAEHYAQGQNGGPELPNAGI